MNLIKKLYILSTGYSYTHMGRLFLRLFVGVMMMQFGLRQIACFDQSVACFPAVAGMSPATSMTVLIVIEILCSLFIMCGFLTRVMTIPPFIAMIIAEYFLLNTSPEASYMISWNQPGYLPMMFMGIYFFILLVGPGKISVDYFVSLHFLHSNDHSEDELEEV